MPEEKLLDRVRKLLAKAEDESCTPAEAEALSGKAAELMSLYGIERAMLGALRPESDKPSDKKFVIANPWGDVKVHLLAGIAVAFRCQVVKVGSKRSAGDVVLHVFGYESDIERAEMLWTSLQVQMLRAVTRAAETDGYWAIRDGHGRAWRRSYMLGYCTAVINRVKEQEKKAADASEAGSAGMSTALVLADRSLVVKTNVAKVYPKLRTSKVTYSGGGYGHGHAAGQKADIGSTKLGGGRARALTR